MFLNNNMVKKSARKELALARKSRQPRKISELLKTQRSKNSQERLRTTWRRNQIDDKQGQTLSGMSQPALEEADDEYYRVESDYHTEMNKKYKEAAEEFRARYISEHGWKSYTNLVNSPYGYYDDLSVTLVVNGRERRADLLCSLGEHGYSMF